jgi:hypothetical membrane protein
VGDEARGVDPDPVADRVASRTDTIYSFVRRTKEIDLMEQLPPSRTASPATAAFVVAPIAFTLVWVVLGFLSHGYQLWGMHIAPYSPVAQPISGLGMGSTASFMNTAFVAYGLAMIWGSVAFARSLPSLDQRTRRSTTLLLGLHGLGAIMVGVFNLEAIMLHLAGFLLVVSPALTFPLIARWLRDVPGWRSAAAALRVAAVLTLLLTVAYFATFDPEAAGDNTGIGGLTQRLLVLQLGGWFVWLGVRARRTHAPQHALVPG